MPHVYFLIKFYGSGSYVAYGSGISLLTIPDLHTCRIMRWYPAPMIDITPKLEKLQRHWKAVIRWRRWYRRVPLIAHPKWGVL
jgi:hypothetical protein